MQGQVVIESVKYHAHWLQLARAVSLPISQFRVVWGSSTPFWEVAKSLLLRSIDGSRKLQKTAVLCKTLAF